MSKPKLDKKIEIPDNVLKQLLTTSELRMLKNRWQILSLLEQGLSIRGIAEEVKVGTDTVVRVARMAEKMGIKKLSRGKKIIQTSKTSWIFGKND